MARRRVLSSFVVTLGVLALLVAFSLRQAGAQADPPTENTTLVANLPVAGMVKPDLAAVHVVNLGRDHTAPAEKFTIMFVNPSGVQIIPSQQCEIGAGQTCTVYLAGKDCPYPAKGRCTFRAVVVGEPIACPKPDMGTGEWMANLEMINPEGTSRYVAGETGTLRLPTTNNCSTVDAPSADAPGGGGPDIPPDAFVPSIDVAPDAFVPSIDIAPDAFVPSIDAAPPVDAAPSVDVL